MLTYEQRVFVTAEKLYTPVRMAADYGVRILLEPHGPITDSIRGIQDVFDLLGNPDSLGVNLDTGNSWLGGADPVEMARVFKDKIHHVHWKDLSAEWEPKRGTEYGCGFSTIALGDGVIDIKGVCDVLRDAPLEHSTLEIVGSEDILKKSVDYYGSGIVMNSSAIQIEDFDGAQCQAKKHVLMPGVVEPGESPADPVVLDRGCLVGLRGRRCMLFNWMPWHRNRSCKHGDGFAKAAPGVRESGVLPKRD